MGDSLKKMGAGLRFFIEELFFFTIKELRAVLFPALFLLTLLVSNYVEIPGLPRYDFLFIAALLIQVFLVVFKLESKDEAKTIFLFHIIGMCLELFKTHPSVGSWSYPEAGYLKIMDVPLYSGFMYAAVGSYIAHAWKTLNLRLTNHPPYWLSVVLCFFIYLNFFTNHFIYDYRIFLYVAIVAIYFRTFIHFTPRKREYKMSLIVGFLLTAFFIWIAENIATFYGAWKYPGQIHVWEVVSFHKISSWFLLVIISFIIVAWLKHFKGERAAKKKLSILFVCKGNVGRSQIAEALFRKKLGNEHEIVSAGTKISGPEEPIGNLLPNIQEVLDVMKEEGVDVSGAIRKQLTEEMVDGADKIVVIMENEEFFPDYLANSKKLVRWNIPDPKGKDLEFTRKVKEEIKKNIDILTSPWPR